MLLLSNVLVILYHYPNTITDKFIFIMQTWIKLKIIQTESLYLPILKLLITYKNALRVFIGKHHDVILFQTYTAVADNLASFFTRNSQFHLGTPKVELLVHEIRKCQSLSKVITLLGFYCVELVLLVETVAIQYIIRKANKRCNRRHTIYFLYNSIHLL